MKLRKRKILSGDSMKEKPILFSDPMIQAILEGRKTQTRRVMKDQKGLGSAYDFVNCENNGCAQLGVSESSRGFGLYVGCGEYPEEGSEFWKSPYGSIGEGLWVRETWGMEGTGTCGVNGHIDVCYRATDEKGIDPISIEVSRKEYIKYLDRWNKANSMKMPWTSSIHMPRWASRLDLEITDIRVERLQDISKEDCIAEGMEGLKDIHGGWHESYAELWDSINGKPRSDGLDIRWNANPWVWVVTFKKI